MMILARMSPLFKNYKVATILITSYFDENVSLYFNLIYTS